MIRNSSLQSCLCFNPIVDNTEDTDTEALSQPPKYKYKASSNFPGSQSLKNPRELKVEDSKEPLLISNPNGNLYDLKANTPSFDKSDRPFTFEKWVDPFKTKKQFEVVLPINTTAGDIMHVNVGDGKMLEVSVPEGLVAGDLFVVEVDEEMKK